MGEALGRYIAGMILMAIVIAALVGAALALGGWFGISWLSQHVSIGWH